MKYFVLLFVFVSACFSLHAQDFEIPSDVKFENEEDYKKYEPLVLKSIDWIQETPADADLLTRKHVNRFLLNWIMGSPMISIELNEGLVPTDCTLCLMAFMSGWAKYSLENDYSNDKVECVLAGIERAINFYERNERELGDNSGMKSFIKQKKNGELRTYVESKI